MNNNSAASTLGQLSQGKNNNLNLIRLIAAFMVMYMHSLALCIADQSKDIMYTLTFHKALSGQVAVDIFFVISGFLIYRSYDRGNNVWKYLKARFLRIWPLLALFILLTAFIIGPMYTVYTREEYFAVSMKDYLMNLLFASSYTRLHGVFLSHISKSINGSIWTLRFEVICYIMVLFVLPVFRRWKKGIFPFILVIVAGYVFFTYGCAQELFLGMSKEPFVNLFRLTLHFAMGIMYYLYRDEIKLDRKKLLIALGVQILITFFFDFEIAFALAGSYIIMYLGFQNYKISRAYDKVGDLSYGVYIWSFLVQQLVVEYMGYFPEENINGFYVMTMDPYVNLALSTLIVVPLAFVSWQCFEKQLLKLK